MGGKYLKTESYEDAENSQNTQAGNKIAWVHSTAKTE